MATQAATTWTPEYRDDLYLWHVEYRVTYRKVADPETGMEYASQRPFFTPTFQRTILAGDNAEDAIATIKAAEQCDVFSDDDGHWMTDHVTVITVSRKMPVQLVGAAAVRRVEE